LGVRDKPVLAEIGAPNRTMMTPEPLRCRCRSGIRAMGAAGFEPAARANAC
jgi:hypothetical protein